MALTEVEKDTLFGFLDELMERFGDDGCNDMSLPRNRENRELIRAAEDRAVAVSDLTEEERFTQPRSGPLLTNNIDILSYIKHRLEEELGSTSSLRADREEIEL